jgi:hypothetical protein
VALLAATGSCTSIQLLLVTFRRLVMFLHQYWQQSLKPRRASDGSSWLRSCSASRLWGPFTEIQKLSRIRPVGLIVENTSCRPKLRQKLRLIARRGQAGNGHAKFLKLSTFQSGANSMLEMLTESHCVHMYLLYSSSGIFQPRYKDFLLLSCSVFYQ